MIFCKVFIYRSIRTPQPSPRVFYSFRSDFSFIFACQWTSKNDRIWRISQLMNLKINRCVGSHSFFFRGILTCNHFQIEFYLSISKSFRAVWFLSSCFYGVKWRRRRKFYKFSVFVAGFLFKNLYFVKFSENTRQKKCKFY